MPQAATIKSLPRAFRMMKAMQAHRIEWGDDHRQSAAAALIDIPHGTMAPTIDRHLEDMDRLDQADRRNGTYPRRPMTELGEIALSVPRTRRFRALTVVRAFARRPPHVDRMILACFVPGLGARKAASALAPVLGRRLKDICPVAMLDGLPALQDHRGAQGRARAPQTPSSAASARADPAHGRVPGPDLHGPHPVRRLRPRKLNPGSTHPLLPDTNLLTLPWASSGARRTAAK